MREVAFIKQNKEKWLHFEQAIFGKNLKNPDELASLYIHLVNDLAYAQTYYPKSKTILYLNNLAAKAFQKIYKTKREDTNRFVHFWKIEVPLIVYEYRRYVLYAFIIFGSFVGIGALSAAFDDTFVRLILGNHYVNMTLENIEKGDPVAVYKSGSNWGSFIGITLNNLYVGIRTFILGVFGGLGTGLALLYNGIMLGSFSLVSNKSSLHGVKILISTFPFTFAAGFLEGYVTRYSNSMPNWLSVGIILLTLGIISFYYLVYPFLLNRKVLAQRLNIEDNLLNLTR